MQEQLPVINEQMALPIHTPTGYENREMYNKTNTIYIYFQTRYTSIFYFYFLT